MMLRRKSAASVALVVLTIGGAVSLYQTLFCLWMCAHPLYQSAAWIARFYYRLATTTVVAALWMFVAVWLLRHRRN
jgi:hypothetical protein